MGPLAADSLLLPAGRIYLGRANEIDPVTNPLTGLPLTSSLGREAALVLCPQPCRRLPDACPTVGPSPLADSGPIHRGASIALRPKIIRHSAVLGGYRPAGGRAVDCRLHGRAVDGTLSVSPNTRIIQ